MLGCEWGMLAIIGAEGVLLYAPTLCHIGRFSINTAVQPLSFYINEKGRRCTKITVGAYSNTPIAQTLVPQPIIAQ
ncbi:MAG: hypothetical protein OIF50_13065, partial [Flavobacteriaceae bacterium]|nr:hypothetical protein [Flavobacteriaceae bacterium]